MSSERESDRHIELGARRPRRLRRTAALRGLVRETVVRPEQLVLPIFLVDGHGARREPIEAMPGVARHTLASAAELAREAADVGVVSFALFPRIDDALKTPDGVESKNPDNLVCRALRSLRKAVPGACLVADVALDPFSSHGHDGIVVRGEVHNDLTVAALCEQACVQAEAGADIVAPSDMMDGRVGAIRRALDAAGLEHAAILSYCAKYASAFYGPFRAALDSAPVDAPDIPRDKSTYQMDPANVREAFIEAALDVAEGADLLMVKPALPYLDVLARLRDAVDVPLAAYHVSGEYAMLRAAAERGWADYDRCLAESLTSIRRAGADVIFTYGALDFARALVRHRG
jgi:porphobilinogen synthase